MKTIDLDQLLYGESIMTPIQKAVYDKCMKLAAEANRKYVPNKADLKSIKKFGYCVCHEARKWIEMCEDFMKGVLSEEEIKYQFTLQNIYDN